MPSAYSLYNKYIYVNGRWERLNDPPSSGSPSVLNFVESMSSTNFLNLNLADLAVDSVYNVIDGFTTDSRFLEGAGIQVPDGTFVAVITQGTVKYFNILGSAFNMDYIQNEITYILTVLNAIDTRVEWANLVNKPFTYIGEGLDVDENDNLNAKQLKDDLTALQTAVANLDFSWSHITNKPFNTVGQSLRVVNNVLEMGEWDWNDIADKPFDSLGSEFNVSNDELAIESVDWEKIDNKPFDDIYSYDFYIETVLGKQQLRISSDYVHEEFDSADMTTLRTIINS